MITDIQLMLAVHDNSIRLLNWMNDGKERTFHIEDVVEGFEDAQLPFAPSVKICADDLHAQQDELGYLFCHWCGKRLADCVKGA